MKSIGKRQSPFHSRGGSTPPQVGVGWYVAEEWAKVKSSATDAERFEASFSEWETMAEKFLAEIRGLGIDARKSFIIASDFLAWCLATDKVNNAAARAEFVAQQGRQSTERMATHAFKGSGGTRTQHGRNQAGK